MRRLIVSAPVFAFLLLAPFAIPVASALAEPAAPPDAPPDKSAPSPYGSPAKAPPGAAAEQKADEARQIAGLKGALIRANARAEAIQQSFDAVLDVNGLRARISDLQAERRRLDAKVEGLQKQVDGAETKARSERERLSKENAGLKSDLAVAVKELRMQELFSGGLILLLTATMAFFVLRLAKQNRRLQASEKDAAQAEEACAQAERRLDASRDASAKLVGSGIEAVAEYRIALGRALRIIADAGLAIDLPPQFDELRPTKPQPPVSPQLDLQFAADGPPPEGKCSVVIVDGPVRDESSSAPAGASLADISPTEADAALAGLPAAAPESPPSLQPAPGSDPQRGTSVVEIVAGAPSADESEPVVGN